MKKFSKTTHTLGAAIALAMTLPLSAAAADGVEPFLAVNDSSTWTIESVCDEHRNDLHTRQRAHFERDAAFQLWPAFVIGPAKADADLLESISDAHRRGGVAAARTAFADYMTTTGSKSFVQFFRTNNGTSYDMKNLSMRYIPGTSYTGPVDWDDCTQGSNGAGAAHLAGTVDIDGVAHFFQMFQYTASLNGGGTQKRIVVVYRNASNPNDHFGQSHGGGQ